MRDCRETVLNFASNAPAGVAEQGREFFFEPIVLIGLTDEVEDGQTVFSFCQAQASSELLKKDGQGFGWPQEEYRIDFRDVDAFVIEVNDEDEADTAFSELTPGGCAVGSVWLLFIIVPVSARPRPA